MHSFTRIRAKEQAISSFQVAFRTYLCSCYLRATQSDIFFLSLLLQVVVLNKIDLPEVENRREELEAALKEHMGHTRYINCFPSSRVICR